MTTTYGPLISVVICTRNRAELLREALASVVSQDYPRSRYEILVVDNNSTDHTVAVIEEFKGKADIVCVTEDRIGLCIARNSGWRTARGEYIAYFDDDAIAHAGWLDAISDAIDRGGSKIGVVGGRVDPIWQGERPPWLSDKIAGSLTIVDWGPRERVIADLSQAWLVGANMVVPKRLLESAGGFNPRLDRYKDILLSSGDVFLQKQLSQKGYKILYVPSISISHVVPASRLVQSWFCRRYYWQGISDAVMHSIEHAPTRRQRIRAASARAARLLRSPKRLFSLAARTDNPDLFTQKCLALIDIGFIWESIGAARR
jgi:glucosyl-dolichyl phosphate glucuronosyltransferase